MPMLAVQLVVQPHDAPIANVVYLVFQQLGPSVFIAVAQAILLNNLLPRFHAIDPTISETDVLDSGATGFESHVPWMEVPGVLEEYARSLDKVFLMAAVVAAAAAILALCVEWKSIKKDEKINEEEKLDVYLDSRENYE